MPFGKLPKAFGLPSTKIYFPHLFDTLENQNYVGPLPDEKFYSPDTMSPDEREKFTEWHTKLKKRKLQI